MMKGHEKFPKLENRTEYCFELSHKVVYEI